VKNTKARATENREQIIAEAARQFRAHGFAGIGVADLMRQVGLTHGGFYAHFSSKSDLMQLACRRAVSDMLADWQVKADKDPDDPIGAIVRPYLTAEHRDQPATGCLLAALGPESARQEAPVRLAVTECLAEVLDTLARHMPHPTEAERRREAIILFSTMVGSLVAARAAVDRSLSDELLRTVLDRLAAPRRSEDPLPEATTSPHD
jgi:TetR/AcrR family transcriptional regulator, transcriptional repressor for nem operon